MPAATALEVCATASILDGMRPTRPAYYDKPPEWTGSPLINIRVGEESSVAAITVSVSTIIRIAGETAFLAGDEAIIARSAVADAVAFVDSHPRLPRPSVEVSSDGIASLQWARGDRGVTLIFVGDGEASIAMRNDLHDYTDDLGRFRATDDIPALVTDALKALALA